LTGKRKKVEGKLERRDVIQEFSNYGSQTYAPLTRIGMFLDRGSEQFVVKSKHLQLPASYRPVDFQQKLSKI
jgi:hypothetical protein